MFSDMVTYTQTFFYCNFPQFYFFFLYIFHNNIDISMHMIYIIYR